MNSIELPKITRNRMVQLLSVLKNWPEVKITSVALSEATGWKSSLIRHDLWLIKFNKGISNGYNTQELINAIEVALGIKPSDKSNNQNSNDAANLRVDSGPVEATQNNVCIAGLGRLGAALLDNTLLYNSSFVIKAGFDSNVNRVEILRSIFPLYPASEMNYVIKKENIKYAILAVPDKDAQNMANRLVTAGIKGIINMTNVILKVPESVKIENLSIVNALNLIL